MGDYTPVIEAGDQFTQTASATITGGQILENTGDGTVGPAGAASVKVVGVAAHDAASGTPVSVYGLFTVHETVAGTGGLTAGQNVQAGAAGTIVTTAAAVLASFGVCIKGATATNKARWIGR
jgi:hypothetical protein